MENLRKFTQTDWYGFAGCTEFEDGTPPLIWYSKCGNKIAVIDGESVGFYFHLGEDFSVRSELFDLMFSHKIKDSKKAEKLLEHFIKMDYDSLLALGFEPICIIPNEEEWNELKNEYLHILNLGNDSNESEKFNAVLERYEYDLIYLFRQVLLHLNDKREFSDKQILVHVIDQTSETFEILNLLEKNNYSLGELTIISEGTDYTEEHFHYFNIEKIKVMDNLLNDLHQKDFFAIK